MISIEGTANYYNLETGFWGIETNTGKKYLPVNMPEQLKMRNKKVRCRAILLEGDSFFQWGEMIRIISFETVF